MSLDKIIYTLLTATILTACNNEAPSPAAKEYPIRFDISMSDNARSSRYQDGASITTNDNLTRDCQSIHVMGIFSYYLLHAFDKWLNYSDGDWHFYDHADDREASLRKQLYWTTDFTNPLSWSLDSHLHPSFHRLDFYAVGNTVGTGDPELHYMENFYTNKYIYGEHMGGTAYLNYITPSGKEWINDVLWAGVDTYSTPTADTQEEVNNIRVSLEMKHAMSKIMFTFENKNPYTYIEVENIMLNNVYCNGRLMFEKDFNGNISTWWDASQYSNKNHICYGSGYLHMRQMFFNGTETPYYKNNEEKVEIPTKQMLDHNGAPFYYLAIPQTIEHWDVTNSYNAPSVSFWMTIHNKNYADNNYTDPNDNKSNPVPAHWQWITIPLSSENNAVIWQPGKAYTYHVVFGDVDGWLQDGTPAIVRVECGGFKVEPFAAGGTFTPEMK